MYFPAIHDERTTLRNYMQVQLQAIRDAAYGLTDAQARRQPLASVFSVSGVIKHCSYVLRSRLAAAGVLDAKPGYEDFMASFAPDENEDLTTLLEDYDRLCEQYLKLVEETDLDQVVQAPPAPWYGRNEPAETTMRYLIVHNLEEFARHAGHADIIREQIDGAKAAELNAAVEGRPANKFVTPWKK